MKKRVSQKDFWKSLDSALSGAESVETRILALSIAQNLEIPFEKAMGVSSHLQKASEIFVKARMKGYRA